MPGSGTELDDEPIGSTDEAGRLNVTIFECEHCGARRFQRIVSYDRFGFPICPACDRTVRPDPFAPE